MTQPASTASPATDEVGRTPPWRYAIGMFGTSIPINMIKGSALLFYVHLLGMDVVWYGIVMTVYAVIDAVDNPVLGYLSDRTRSRFGRRRPWLVIGAPLLGLSMIAYFATPSSLTGAGLVIWFAVFAILCEAFDSLLNANYGALLPELFPNEARRAKANSLRQGFQLAALVISLALTPLLTTSVFGTPETTGGFTITAVIYAVVAVAVIWVMAFSAKENPRNSDAERPRFFSSIKEVLANRMFWTVGITGACYGIAMAMVLSGVQLYVVYTLGLPPANALYLQGVVILASVGFLFFWTPVVRRRGAAWTWRLAFPLLALGFVALFFASNLITGMVAGLVLGFGWAGMLATNDLIVARVLDDDARRNGAHREGLFLSAFGFFGRLNAAFTGWAVASLALFFGYRSGDDPGSDPALAWRFYLTVYPFVLTAIGSVLARLIKIPEPAEPAGQGTVQP